MCTVFNCPTIYAEDTAGLINTFSDFVAYLSAFGTGVRSILFFVAFACNMTEMPALKAFYRPLDSPNSTINPTNFDLLAVYEDSG